MLTSVVLRVGICAVFCSCCSCRRWKWAQKKTKPGASWQHVEGRTKRRTTGACVVLHLCHSSRVPLTRRLRFVFSFLLFLVFPFRCHTGHPFHQHSNVQIDRFGRLARLTCVGGAVEVGNLTCLVGRHASLMSGLVSHYENGHIADLINFFRGDWAAALYVNGGWCVCVCVCACGKAMRPGVSPFFCMGFCAHNQVPRSI